jgi:hypothetical protein
MAAEHRARPSLAVIFSEEDDSVLLGSVSLEALGLILTRSRDSAVFCRRCSLDCGAATTYEHLRDTLDVEVSEGGRRFPRVRLD